MGLGEEAERDSGVWNDTVITWLVGRNWKRKQKGRGIIKDEMSLWVHGRLMEVSSYDLGIRNVLIHRLKKVNK